MSEPFVGEIRMFAGNFAPRGWAFCDGQLLAVSQNDALFLCLARFMAVMVELPLDYPICGDVFPFMQEQVQGFPSVG